MISIRVDLPAPFGPTIAVVVPACRRASTPWSTSTPSYAKQIPVARSSGVVIIPS